MILSFDEAGALLDEMAEEFPPEFYDELNGGIALLPEAKEDPEGEHGELYIMGEYCNDMMGKYINLYYGSFAALAGPAGYGGPVRRIAAVVRGGVGMKVEFGVIEETAILGFKGGEGVTHARMFADGRNRIMRGRLEPGCSIGLHTHEGSSEIVYVLSGTGKALYGGGEERLAPGDCHYCPEGHAHSLVNDGTQTLEFFAVVPQHG